MLNRKFIVKVIRIIDPNDFFRVNPLHVAFFTIVAFPLIALRWKVDPIFSKIVLCVFILYALLLVLKFIVKEEYKSEFTQIKEDVSHLNIFHIVMFLLISSPFLFFIYKMVF